MSENFGDLNLLSELAMLREAARLRVKELSGMATKGKLIDNTIVAVDAGASEIFVADPKQAPEALLGRVRDSYPVFGPDDGSVKDQEEAIAQLRSERGFPL